MLVPAGMLLPAGLLFPESVLQSPLITVLAAFVAVNTVIYATLAIAKLLPALRWGDFLPSRQRRSETRSIYPESTRKDSAQELRPTHVGAVAATSAATTASFPTASTATVATWQGRVRRTRGGAPRSDSRSVSES